MAENGRWDAGYVTAAGVRLRVARHGAGRPLLLITGIGAHLDMWAPFALHAGERELIAFDPPGAGLSQRPRRPLRMTGLAGVVTELLDELGLERVDVLGYSFGGGLAQELAHRAPERVRRLVLVRDRAGHRRQPAQTAGGTDAGHAGALLPPAAARAQPRAHRGRAHRARARRPRPARR
jgi:pimeloyl-ACP methyl ester carboxylesterase